mgnify:CR=1 FL=1
MSFSEIGNKIIVKRISTKIEKNKNKTMLGFSPWLCNIINPTSAMSEFTKNIMI